MGGTESSLQFLSLSHCLPLGLLSSQQRAEVRKTPLPHSPDDQSSQQSRQPRILWVSEIPRGRVWESALLSISPCATPGASHFSVSIRPCVELTLLGGRLHTIRSTQPGRMREWCGLARGHGPVTSPVSTSWKPSLSTYTHPR